MLFCKVLLSCTAPMGLMSKRKDAMTMAVYRVLLPKLFLIRNFKEEEQEAITGSLLSKRAGLKKTEEDNWWALERGGNRKKKRGKYFIMLTKRKLKHNCISEVSIWYLRISTRFEHLTIQQGFLKDLILDWLSQHYFGTIQYH